jgi:AcrR family transcriptional regulator
MKGSPARRPAGARKGRASAASPPAGREVPRTARGMRTRAQLIQAARRVFEREGYLDARLADITAEAGTAAGSFYTYFSGKEEIFAAVLEEVQDEMLHPHVRDLASNDDPAAVIEASNRAYLESFKRNARLMALLEQVATIDERFRELRHRRTQAFGRRNAQAIHELQLRGLADPALDPELTAAALSYMVSRTAYASYVLGEDYDLDQLVETLTRVWVNALRLPRQATQA